MNSVNQLFFCFTCALVATTSALRVSPSTPNIEVDNPPTTIVLDNYLNKEDQGVKSPEGWLIPGKHSVGFVHIPKTAGSSFGKDAKWVLPKGIGMFSSESCLSSIERAVSSPNKTIGTFVRHPTSHVYSQFLELKDNRWGAGSVKNYGNVTQWLKSFISNDNIIKEHHPSAYHPWNMQSRFFLCKGRGQRYQDVDNDQAIPIMKATTFVGITEHYQESMCLLFDKLQPETALPEWCNCENATQWSQFKSKHVTHRSRKHSVTDMSQEDLEMIGKLTTKDKILYEAALNRFVHEIDELEKRKGIKVSCQWKAS